VKVRTVEDYKLSATSHDTTASDIEKYQYVNTKVISFSCN
jgi:hypothetical protein